MVRRRRTKTFTETRETNRPQEHLGYLPFPQMFIYLFIFNGLEAVNPTRFPSSARWKDCSRVSPFFPKEEVL